jgi:hypothetical protein
MKQDMIRTGVIKFGLTLLKTIVDCFIDISAWATIRNATLIMIAVRANRFTIIPYRTSKSSSHRNYSAEFEKRRIILVTDTKGIAVASHEGSKGKGCLHAINGSCG